MPAKNVIKLRQGSASAWNSINPVLASGEPGYDFTNNILKIGDGSTSWTNLKSVVDITKNTEINGTFTAPTGNFADSLNVRATILIDQNNNIPYPINFYDVFTIDADDEVKIYSGNKIVFRTVNEESMGLIDSSQIGGFYGCSMDKTIIGEYTPSVATFSVLNATQSAGVSGALTIRNGDIRVYDDNSPYNTTISSSGLKINYTTSVTDVDLVDLTSLPTPSGFLNNFTINDNAVLSYFPRRPVVGEKVLFRNFTDSIQNGVYELQSYLGSQNVVSPVRVSPYTSGAVIANLSRIKNKYDNSVYILNYGTNGGNSTIGTSSLVFTRDLGDQVMTIQNSKDVDFAASISATAKYFRIQHPDPASNYSYLQYGSLESPYNGVRLTGSGMLKKGFCIINLPKYITYLISEKDINIQLTNKGHHKMLYVDSIDLKNSSFTVKGYRAKTGGPFEFFWTFTGVRKDIAPLVVEQ